MITITIDKNTAREKSISVDRISEAAYEGKMSLHADLNKKITTASDFPDVSAFITGTEFETLEISNGDVIVPIEGDYNRVDSSSYEYNADGSYAFSMMLGYKAAV